MLKDNYIQHLKDLQQLSEEYAEKIISRIYASIRLSDWETTADDVLNILWEGYEKNYKMTERFLKVNYGIESSIQPFISDFKSLLYHRDGIDIEERTKRKIEYYQEHQLEANIKQKVAYEIGRQEKTGHKQFFFNLSKQKLTEVYPSSRIYVSIDNLDKDYEDCFENVEGGVPLCEDKYDKIQHVRLSDIQDTDLPPYHPECECYPIFEIEQEEL